MFILDLVFEVSLVPVFIGYVPHNMNAKIHDTHKCCQKLMYLLGGGFKIYLGKISHLTNIFQMGWNHQPVFNSILYLVCLFQMSDIISSHPHSQFGSVKLPGLRMVVGLPWAFIRHWSRRSRGAGVKSTRKIRVFVAKDLGSTRFFQWFLFLTLRNYGITVSPIMEVERDGFFYIRGNYIWRDTHLFIFRLWEAG